MDAPQLVLLLIGALLVGGGTTGLVLFGGEGAATLYAVTFPTTTQDLPLEGDWSGAGGSFAFAVTRLNVTAVNVATSCTDANPLGGQAAPVSVTVTVTGPNGLAGEAAGNCGSAIEVPVVTGAVPAATTAQGTSPEDALRNLPPTFTLTNATGEWSVEVEASRSGQAGGILPGQAGQASGTLTVEVVAYDALAAPAVVR